MTEGKDKKRPSAKTPPPPSQPPIIHAFGASPAPDPDFDAVGFDTDKPVENVDDDDTPPSGIYVGGEEVQVIDATALGKALAAANGLQTDFAGPKLEELRAGLVGLDLGASVAVIARFNDDGKHEVVPNAEDELGTPAHVFFDEDGEQLVGKEARRLGPSAPDRAFVSVKTLLGESGFSATVGDGTQLKAEDILSAVAKRLLDDVTERTGQRPTHAALAAPVWFLPPQKDALRRAVEKAGIEVVGVTEEPLAATVPYSLQLRDLNPRKAAVFDLGHSGLGCAIVQCAKGDITILAAEARRDLGATRWDDVIAEEGARHFYAQHQFDPRDDKGAALDLKLRAEEAKKSLSQKPTATLVVSAQGKSVKISFTRPSYEEATQALVEECRAFLNQVRVKASVPSWNEVDAVILTGGGTRIPSIKRMVVKETGREPVKGINPDEGVAIGALYWGLFARSNKDRDAKKTPKPPKKK
ncbi:MAG: Hsp70 family protein [Planctomycetota bacterium]